MNTTLLALNSSFSHTSLAARYLRAAGNGAGHEVSLVEMTVNERAEAISRAVFATRPEVLGCSVYIWNVRLMSDVCVRLKLLIPQLVIVWGGPEVVGEEASLCLEYPLVDVFCIGEGESAFPEILDNLANGIPVDRVITGSPTNLESLLDPYGAQHEFDQNRLHYFETSRGCPYNCAYCISSRERGVRYLPEQIVLSRLGALVPRVPLVKFVDRTFNADAPRARRLWEHLLSLPGGCRLHCEICAHLLTEDDFAFFARVDARRLQLEIGLQSASPHALAAVNRRIDPEAVLSAVRRLVGLRTVEVHLDLIAGLPGEGYRQFLASFEMAIACRPHRLHLGFLKLLPGTELRSQADMYRMRYLPFAPYEVLATEDISAEEMLLLKGLEEAVEFYYNSRRFVHSVSALLDACSAVDLFQDLSHSRVINAERALFDAGLGRGIAEALLRELLLLDFLLREPHRAPPAWLAEGSNEQVLLREIVYGTHERLHVALPHRQGEKPGLVLRDLRLCVLSAPTKRHLGHDPDSLFFLIDHGQPMHARVFPVR